MSDSESGRSTRSKRVVIVVVIGGLVAVLLGVLWVSGRHTATPYSVEGWAATNMSGTAISLHASEDGGDGEGYVIAGARWAGSDGSWHEGGGPATCVGTDTTVMTRVRLGLVDVDGEHASWTQVVWLRCLG